MADTAMANAMVTIASLKSVNDLPDAPDEPDAAVEDDFADDELLAALVPTRGEVL